MNRNTFYIEKCQVDLLHSSIRQGDAIYEVEPKAMDVLVYLARHVGKTIDKQELQKVVWPSEEVTDAALSRIINQLRRCFNDNVKPHSYIMTVRKTGYRLIADVTPKGFFARQLEESSFNGAGIKKRHAFFAAILIPFVLLYFYWISLSSSEQSFESRYITTHKGEVFSQALSPDGKKVVYRRKPVDFEGDNYYDFPSLYIKDIESDNVIQLTDLEGLSFHPSWSPDNRYIAFAQEASLPNWEVNYEIYIVDIHTRQAEVIAKVSSHTHGIAWSPDGRYLVYPDGLTPNKQLALTRLDIETKEKQFIIGPEDSDGYYGYPGYSPDGKTIAVVRTDNSAYDTIELLNTENWSRQSIFNPRQKISSMVWKDNDTLLIGIGSLGATRLLEFSTSNNKFKVIDIGHHYFEYLSYSRQAQRLTFESIQRSSNLFYTRYADDDYKILDYGPLSKADRQNIEAAESPDGHYLAMISSRSGAFEIWLKSTVTGQLEKLTDINANHIKGLDWSPYNDKLAFVAVVNNETALYWVDMTDRQLRQFSHGDHNYSIIGWENQNQTLLFSSNASGAWKLWRYFAHDNNAEVVSDAPVVSGRLSPNRKILYLIKHKESGIWRTKISNFNPSLVPGTQLINTVDSSWTVAENGIYYLKLSGAGEEEYLYFQRFNQTTPIEISFIRNIYVNRFYWSKNRLFYSAYDLQRNSDIVLIENFK